MIFPLEPFHHLVSLLKQIGFREKESLVYITLLAMGPSVVTNIAKKIQLPRSTTYNIITYLLRRGMIKEKMYYNQKIYEADDPLKIIEYLMSQRKRMDQYIEKMHQTLEGLKKRAAP